MENKMKVSKSSSQKKIINKINRVKIIRKEYLEEDKLIHFYDYMKLNKIEETEDTEKADLIISFGGDGTLRFEEGYSGNGCKYGNFRIFSRYFF